MDCLIKIYGERNTNTNYLEQLIRLNLKAKIIPGVVPGSIHLLQSAMPGREWVRDSYFLFTWRSNLGWKHAKLSPEIVNKINHSEKNNIKIISITKNPYSWLLSLYRNPYHQYYKKKPDFESFLTAPWDTVGRDLCGGQIENPIQLWNIKNRSYLKLNDIGGCILTTEGIFKSPEDVLELISTKYEIPKIGVNFKNVLNCVKGGGDSFETYRQYYLEEHWKDNLSLRDISIVNKYLDIELMEFFGYTIL